MKPFSGFQKLIKESLKKSAICYVAVIGSKVEPTKHTKAPRLGELRSFAPSNNNEASSMLEWVSVQFGCETPSTALKHNRQPLSAVMIESHPSLCVVGCGTEQRGHRTAAACRHASRRLIARSIKGKCLRVGCVITKCQALRKPLQVKRRLKQTMLFVLI